ncbi:hypothetical protein NIES2104_21830 [Leptolyngbya sp. NIES-2104]|nr:hypothetical protein NIES2104_21830 [Leptolyngbya sp. NIES-2104]
MGFAIALLINLSSTSLSASILSRPGMKFGANRAKPTKGG